MGKGCAEKSTHPRSLETDPFTSFANSKLHGTSNDTALGCALRLTLTDEETAFGPESITALVTDKAALMPLTTDGCDDDVVQDVLLTA